MTPIGISQDNPSKLHNLNSARVGALLTRTIDPVKYLMVTSSGGVLDKSNSVMPEIALRKDLQELVRTGVISGGMITNVEEAAGSLYERGPLGDDRSVQIVGPGNLLHELYTHKGKGTFIRTGYEIEKKPIAEVAESAIRKIAADAFTENLRDDYYNQRCQDGAYVLIEANGKGLAVIIGDHMDILAVKNGYQRTGLGTDLVDAALKSQNSNSPSLYWRTGVERPAVEVYNSLKTGRQPFTHANGKEMIAFWIGLSLPSAHEKVQQMQHAPLNF